MGRRVCTSFVSATNCEPDRILSHLHDISIVEFHSHCPCIVDIFSGQNVRSIGNNIADGRCDKRSAGLECHLSRIARTGRLHVRTVVHNVYKAAHNGGGFSLASPPSPVIGYDRCKCAVLSAARIVGSALSGCIECRE